MPEGTQFLKLDEIAIDKPGGSKLGWIQIGEEGTETTIVGYGYMPPNFEAPAHAHMGDYTEIVLEGSQKIGEDWVSAGEARLVKGGTQYGPLVAGPDGVSFLVIFGSPKDSIAIFPDGTTFEEPPAPIVGIEATPEVSTA